MANIKRPYLAIGMLWGHGVTFSRTINEISSHSDHQLFYYMDEEAGDKVDNILLVKDDIVVREIDRSTIE